MKQTPSKFCTLACTKWKWKEVNMKKRMKKWKWKIWKSESDAYSLRILYVGLHKYIQPLVLCQLSVSVFAHSPRIFSNFLYLQLSFTHLRYCFLISELLFSSFFLLFIKNQLILPNWVFPCLRSKFKVVWKFVNSLSIIIGRTICISPPFWYKILAHFSLTFSLQACTAIGQ